MKTYLLAMVFATFTCTVNAQIITTVAGNGTAGYTGDGGPATATELRLPSDIVVDGSGNLYIADSYNSRVRKVSSAGIISTVAGNGTSGYSGDGGPATSAMLHTPRGLALDADGNLYIADIGDFRIRAVSPDGIISTVAGNGLSGYSGDGGPATAAQVSTVREVAFDAAGNMYISDWDNNRIRKKTPDGIIHTAFEISGPEGLAVDVGGNLYVANFYGRIFKITPDSIVTIFAGTGVTSYSGDGGPATAATMSPSYIAFDAAGNLHIADVNHQRIRKITPDGIINTVAGNGTIGGSGDGGPATAAELSQPLGVAFDASGNMYIADFTGHRIRKVINTTSVSNIYEGSNAFTVYPNPATDLITITSQQPIQSIILRDPIGRKVLEGTYNDYNVQVSLTGLPAGVYFMQVNGTEVYKLLKQE